ncbi:MAG: hypothetical protein IKA76_00075 [Clostridia bacterium]|nr:hypothetical protein [Clostridia bacterium]
MSEAITAVRACQAENGIHRISVDAVFLISPRTEAGKSITFAMSPYKHADGMFSLRAHSSQEMSLAANILQSKRNRAVQFVKNPAVLFTFYSFYDIIKLLDFRTKTGDTIWIS